MRSPGTLILLALALLALPGSAQEYTGGPPPKADMLYLLHAENLIETESAEARQEDRDKKTAHIVEGASSPARTPLAEPIFILQSEEIEPQSLQLYAMDVEKGNREVVFPKNRAKKGPRTHHLTFKRVEDDIYWIEVNEWLDNGQYCVTPRGSEQVFCFEVY